MPKIRPISDLRNNFTEISKLVHEAQEPIFITKKGHGDMVVLSMELYEILTQESRIDSGLRKAEESALQGVPRKDFGEVAVEQRKKLIAQLGETADV